MEALSMTDNGSKMQMQSWVMHRGEQPANAIQHVFREIYIIQKLREGSCQSGCEEVTW